MTTIREMIADRRITGELRYRNLDGDTQFWLGSERYGFVAHFVECPRSSWGHGEGDLAARANHMWWADMVEFGKQGKGPDLSDLVEVREGREWGHGDGHVLLSLDVEVPEEYVSVLEDDDYPVIGDGYWEKAEAVVFADDWKGWLAHDLRVAVADALVGPDGYAGDAGDMVGDDDDVLKAYMDAAREEWWEYGPWIADKATSGTIVGTERDGKHVKGLDTLAEDIARLIVREWLVPNQAEAFILLTSEMYA